MNLFNHNNSIWGEAMGGDVSAVDMSKNVLILDSDDIAHKLPIYEELALFVLHSRWKVICVAWDIHSLQEIVDGG